MHLSVESKDIRGLCLFLDLILFKGIAVDYMHCVFLGVTKMLMTWWFDKTHASEDGNIRKHVENVDSRLLNITPPNCISRAPRSIAKDHPHWKASEFFFMVFPVCGTFCLMNTFSISLCSWKQSGY